MGTNQQSLLIILAEIDDELDGIEDAADQLGQTPVVKAAIRTRVEAIRQRVQAAVVVLDTKTGAV